MTSLIRTFQAALSVLTAFPQKNFMPTEEELKRSMNLFPVIGLFLGVLLFVLAIPISALPTLPAAILLTILPECFTKGFHLDGLADTADGFLSSRPRERILEIMHDSHIGTMGVAAIFAILGIKFAIFATIPRHLLPSAALTMLLSGRCAILFHIATSKYAREDGLGKVWFDRKPWFGLVLAALFPVLIFLQSTHSSAQCSLQGTIPLPLLAFVLSPALICFACLWSWVTWRHIRGATGDTIGCCEELAETLALALFTTLLPA